jgi:hypothetical protein
MHLVGIRGESTPPSKPSEQLCWVMHELADTLGKPALLTALSFACYLLGSIAQVSRLRYPISHDERANFDNTGWFSSLIRIALIKRALWQWSRRYSDPSHKVRNLVNMKVWAHRNRGLTANSLLAAGTMA